VGPITGLDDVKRKYCPYQDSKSDPSAGKASISCYTDCAIEDHVGYPVSRRHKYRGLVIQVAGWTQASPCKIYKSENLIPIL
jgi:hypothetical protein